MSTGIRDQPGAKIPIEIFQVLLQIIHAASLRGIVGKLVEITDPVFAVLPVGETKGLHDG